MLARFGLLLLCLGAAACGKDAAGPLEQPPDPGRNPRPPNPVQLDRGSSYDTEEQSPGVLHRCLNTSPEDQSSTSGTMGRRPFTEPPWPSRRSPPPGPTRKH